MHSKGHCERSAALATVSDYDETRVSIEAAIGNGMVE